MTIIGFGPSVVDALKVADETEKNTRISCEIIDLRTINPIDEETIIKSLKKLKICVLLNMDGQTQVYHQI